MYRRDLEFLLECIDEDVIDVVWFGYGNMSYHLISAMKRKRPAVKVVCDTDSVWSRFVLRALPLEKNAFKKIRIHRAGLRKQREERVSTDLCNVTSAVSEVDAEYYRSIARDPARVKVFSNVIDLDNYRTVSPVPPGFRKPSIYLAGSFWNNSPMEFAARWVINDILPLVKVEIPDIHLYIVGNNSDRVLKNINDASVTVTGKVDSVLPYLCNADVAIVPLQFESGTRFKILEAGACAIPVVSTTLGAEGIPVNHEEHLLIADSAEDFARSIVRIVHDKVLSRSLAENGNKLIRMKFSVESLSNEARSILDYLKSS